MPTFLDAEQCVPYTTPEAVLECCDVAAGLDPADTRILEAVEDASFLLYYMTGRVYDGTCTATVRPCVACGCNGEGGCCCEVDKIDLGLWPITDITSIWYEGAAQNVANFHIDEYRFLVRSDSQEAWPRCSNLWAEGPSGIPLAPSAHDNEEDGYVWEVEVEYGLPVPRILNRAARDLACQLLRYSCLGTCELPQRVTSIQRRGLSMSTGDPLDYLELGRTGVYTVDLAIATLNPSRLQSPSFCWTPDRRANRIHRTYT